MHFIGSYNNNNYGNDRSRPYGPPQAVDIPVGYNHGNDWYGGQGLDWGHGGYGGGGGGVDFGSMWEDKLSVCSCVQYFPNAWAEINKLFFVLFNVSVFI